jgi:hypothetical protein
VGGGKEELKAISGGTRFAAHSRNFFLDRALTNLKRSIMSNLFKGEENFLQSKKERKKSSKAQTITSPLPHRTS